MLLISESAREEIARVKKNAKDNKITFDKLRLSVAGGMAPVGDNPSFVCHIPVGFRVVYSIEEQPFGLCHHLSVSIKKADKYPSVESVKTIMQEFGITASLETDCKIWLEEGVGAVNIVAYMTDADK